MSRMPGVHAVIMGMFTQCYAAPVSRAVLLAVDRMLVVNDTEIPRYASLDEALAKLGLTTTRSLFSQLDANDTSHKVGRCSLCLMGFEP